ncbi:hypothetical protein PUN28_015485 [Cardiocondyla obscurior]|uniref:Uncharacterized protein n=1 Tax=Cardiocondyla obscurior TaxID=286306 RepID=A0AAW2EUH9_9HYME
MAKCGARPCRSAGSERHDTFSRARADGTGRYIVASGNEKLLQISRWGKLLVRHGRPARSCGRPQLRVTIPWKTLACIEQKKKKGGKMRTQRMEEVAKTRREGEQIAPG